MDLMDLTLLKKPSACLPIAMSAGALALVAGGLALHGLPPGQGVPVLALQAAAAAAALAPVCLLHL